MNRFGLNESVEPPPRIARSTRMNASATTSSGSVLVDSETANLWACAAWMAYRLPTASSRRSALESAGRAHCTAPRSWA